MLILLVLKIKKITIHLLSIVLVLYSLLSFQCQQIIFVSSSPFDKNFPIIVGHHNQLLPCKWTLLRSMWYSDYHVLLKCLRLVDYHWRTHRQHALHLLKEVFHKFFEQLLVLYIMECSLVELIIFFIPLDLYTHFKIQCMVYTIYIPHMNLRVFE